MDDIRRRELVSAWFEQYADRVLAYLTHRTDPDTAQDLVQEVFVVAYRKAHRVDEPVISWLFGTARRLAANHRRTGQRRQAAFDRAVGEQPVQGGDDATDPALGAALAALTTRDREVLMLAYWYELTPVQAAAVLGCRPNTFTVRLHRARTRLHEQLRDTDLVTRR